jgi:hypothetical protein
LHRLSRPLFLFVLFIGLYTSSVIWCSESVFPPSFLLGVQVGWGYADAQGTKWDEISGKKGRFGYTGGAVWYLHIHPRFSLQGGLAIKRRGFRVTTDAEYDDKDGNHIVMHIESATHLLTGQIPLVALVRMGSFHFGIGGAFNVNFYGSYDEKATINGETQEKHVVFTKEDRYGRRVVNISFLGQLGFIIPFVIKHIPFQLIPELSFDFSILNEFTEIYAVNTNHYMNIMFQLGLVIQLNTTRKN